VWIPTRDGTRLSAAIHWPTGFRAGEATYPALIEYHPYRKDDKSAARAADHDYFAQHGFVSVRLDVRGTGSSEGVNTDEYMAVETTDGYDAVEWLASQSWSNGNVGMFGSSYGGFTSYQVAMLRPPHLRAIVPIYATDDRYTDDCHYKGGALKGYYDVGTYGTMMVALNGLPPGPHARGAGWEQAWLDRIEANQPYVPNWLRNQSDSEYWRQGSLRGNYESIEAATFIIGGWQDGYPNPPLRSYAHLRCQKKVLVGPWNHARPAVAIPGPRIDYLHEMRRWFDLHLKDHDDGISAEPPVTVYLQDFDLPDPSRTETAGQWISYSHWPAPNQALSSWNIGPSGISQEAAEVGELTLSHDPTSGLAGGLWSGGLPFGLPGDQRSEDSSSLVFVSEPLNGEMRIVGNPTCTLTLSSTMTVASVVAKLSDVAPDGQAALITRGVFNLTRRNGLGASEPMDPDHRYDVQIELDATAWRVQSGHRIRLALSTADFPNSWPSPETGELTFFFDSATPAAVTLPITPGDSTSSVEFRDAPVLARAGFDPAKDEWSYEIDTYSGDICWTIGRSAISTSAEGTETASSDHLELSVSRSNPAIARAHGTHRTTVREAEDTFETHVEQSIESDERNFNWTAILNVTRNGELVAERKWKDSFLRELM